MLFPVRLVDFETLRDWECFDADSRAFHPGIQLGGDLLRFGERFELPDLAVKFKPRVAGAPPLTDAMIRIMWGSRWLFRRASRIRRIPFPRRSRQIRVALPAALAFGEWLTLAGCPRHVRHLKADNLLGDVAETPTKLVP